MGKGYLIDTSAISKYLKGNLNATQSQFLSVIMNEIIQVSFITQIELKSWNVADQELENTIENILEVGNIFGISDEIITKTIEIRRKSKVRLPDAIIVATAIVNNLTLLSTNNSDFLKVPKLKYKSLN
jgi:predicted nucleic acid-binding protein